MPLSSAIDDNEFDTGGGGGGSNGGGDDVRATMRLIYEWYDEVVA